jgi:3-oxoacyl-[acyl-carrier protein] reductase
MKDGEKDMKLQNKVAIVTGGAQGLGKAYVLGFVDEGAKVVVADINEKAAQATAEEVVKKGGEALAIRTDVSNQNETEEMATKTIKRFGRIDILVNNAAILDRIPIKQAPFFELEPSEWDRTWNVNVKGPFLCCRAAFPYMKKQGGGKIITISSTHFYRGMTENRHRVHYVSQKGAIIGFTRALARELGEYNINVNCIAPGAIVSEDSPNPSALASRKKAAERRALKRVLYPNDLVGTAVFLASSMSDSITGVTIVVDAGDIMV